MWEPVTITAPAWLVYVAFGMTLVGIVLRVQTIRMQRKLAAQRDALLASART